MQQTLHAAMVATPQPSPGSVRRNARTTHSRQMGRPLLAAPAGGLLARSPGRRRLQTVAQSSSNERNNYNARKGKQFENKKRRRGRPAEMRSPYDTPLRDGNRDRLIGLLTERAAKTLMVYLMETNANVYSWLVEFYKAHPIPKHGSWDEVSGEAFLRRLLAMPIEEAKFNTGRDSLFDNVQSCGVDPRSIAQRIMDIRSQLAGEFIQELQAIAEENSLLLRETLATSLSIGGEDGDGDAAAAAAAAAESGAPVHPEMLEPPPAPAAAPATSSNNDTKQPATTKASSSSKQQTPPSSPAAADSSSSSGAGADNAANVAALNAALKASPGGSSSSGSHPELSSADGGKVDMADVLAQLRRAMDADVARDVSRMTGVPPPAPPATPLVAADGSADQAAAAAREEQEDAAAIEVAAPAEVDAAPQEVVAAAAVEAAAPAADEEQEAPLAAAAGTGEEQDTLAPAAAEVVASSAALDTTEAAAVEGADAATATPPEASADSGSDSDVDGSDGAPLHAAAQALSGAAGMYSRMLPKGWGPRVHSNIVSSGAMRKSLEQQQGPRAGSGQGAGSAEAA